MTAELVIRPATRADLDSVTPLAGSSDRAEMRLRATERGDDSMVVAESSRRVVGVASIRWNDGCLPPHPWLYGLHVATDMQRTGIGRALVGAAESAARDRGCAHLTLDVDIDNPGAITFYEALGYTVARPHRHRWRSLDPRTGAVVNEGSAATLIMWRPLR